MMMNLFAHIRSRKWLMLHFQQRLSREHEKKLRRHLEGCIECQALYLAMMMGEGEGDAAESSQNRHRRLEHALFGSAARPPSRETSEAPQAQTASWRLLLSCGGAISAVLLLALLALLPKEPLFREKGSGQGTSRFVSIEVYTRRDASQRPQPIGRRLGRTDPLAFSYSNQSREHYDRLLLFGIDSTYTVYWFYPSWTDPRQNPASIAIRRGVGVELEDEVTHHYEGRQLRLFAIFTKRRELRVAEVERIVRQLQRRRIPLADFRWFPLEKTGQHTMLLEISEE
jgi:hypothetical protein